MNQQEQAKHTPTPWALGEYDEHLGYDCMTGGVRAGPVVLDAGHYGQRQRNPASHDPVRRMMADAALIVRAVNSHEVLIAALDEIISVDVLSPEGGHEAVAEIHCIARAALAAIKEAA